MIRFRHALIALSAVLILGGSVIGAASVAGAGPPWGFFGHRRINRLAVFTLPVEMMPFFRANVDYLAEHAVDPDKRRYANDYEAVRHYIDLDHWGQYPFAELPRKYADARVWQGRLLDIDSPGDTTVWYLDTLLPNDDILLLRTAARTVDLKYSDYRRLWYGDLESVSRDSVLTAGVPLTGDRVVLEDGLSPYGILPYHLVRFHRRLTEAFVDGQADRILQLAAEMGHYVGDAHVPLHTTENYNGQLTGQTGIHAFWESRLPELFADAEYDYFVGPADYIADPETFYWDIVLDSHRLVDSILQTERRLRATYPEDRQLCHEERLGQVVRTPCTEYARAWSRAMNGMVEERFRAAVRAVGSVWYSCWVDAGQPVLPDAVELPIATVLIDSLPVQVDQANHRHHE
ncbi:zinc dependent phospholipase C family protein [Neolewinella litorea]|uniref:S1/P1 Nuclease n=1 Tax=Neolewinella litorea TaxID=2562452 RepID=A0A4S4NN94_9BACT|nr:zinc dependent phospholipase C family protein [Neolewinella litorea]THH41312.1 hypothetical protein E4021_01570 [Neolewinella litorea]